MLHLYSFVNRLCQKFWLWKVSNKTLLLWFQIFVFIFTQSNWENICWPEILIYGTFFASCCCTVLLNLHMFCRQGKKSVFFRICCSVQTISTFYCWTNRRNKVTFQRDQILVFSKLIFVISSKSQFLTISTA